VGLLRKSYGGPPPHSRLFSHFTLSCPSFLAPLLSHQSLPTLFFATAKVKIPSLALYTTSEKVLIYMELWPFQKCKFHEILDSIWTCLTSVPSRRSPACTHSINSTGDFHKAILRTNPPRIIRPLTATSCLSPGTQATFNTPPLPPLMTSTTAASSRRI